MTWQYGIYKWNWDRERPTQEKFDAWKQDFLSLPNIEKYEVWLSGGFLQNWKTWDIDITLLGPCLPELIQPLLYTGTDLGIKKYNMFVDITYQISPKHIQNFNANMAPQLIKKITLGNMLSENNKVISSSKFGRQINSELFVRYDIYPKEKHLKRVYKHGPVLCR